MVSGTRILVYETSISNKKQGSIFKTLNCSKGENINNNRINKYLFYLLFIE